jgi:hypothetical protein
MSQQAALSPSPDTPHVSPHKVPLTFGIIAGIVGIFLFLATQICAATGAAIWAFAAYFHYGITGISILSLLLVPPALYACWKILVMAINAERDPENN